MTQNFARNKEGKKKSHNKKITPLEDSLGQNNALDSESVLNFKSANYLKDLTHKINF